MHDDVYLVELSWPIKLDLRIRAKPIKAARPPRLDVIINLNIKTLPSS